MRCVLCACGDDDTDSSYLSVQGAVVAQEWRLLPGLRLQAPAQVNCPSRSPSIQCCNGASMCTKQAHGLATMHLRSMPHHDAA